MRGSGPEPDPKTNPKPDPDPNPSPSPSPNPNPNPNPIQVRGSGAQGVLVESSARGRLVRNVIELNGAEGVLVLAGCAPVIGENYVRRNAGDADADGVDDAVADGTAVLGGASGGGAESG